MNIIIVGAGEIGRHLASSLSQEAHAISVIESDAVLAEELDASIDAKMVTGDGARLNADPGPARSAADRSLKNTSWPRLVSRSGGLGSAHSRGKLCNR